MALLDDVCQVWQMVKESYRDGLSDSIIDLWFGGLEIISFSDSVLTMAADSEFKKSVLIHKYKKDLEDRFADMIGFPITIEFVSSDTPDGFENLKKRLREESADRSADKSAANSESEGNDGARRTTQLGSTLPPFNFEYTFENFIVGSSNKFAHAACLAVADNPAQAYNPLFIYGPSGLGKTHLLYAITNELKKKKKDIKVIYIKGEDFTNQMIESLSRQAMNEFRDKYRSCDVLLIDDIQFIAGKVSTQE